MDREYVLACIRSLEIEETELFRELAEAESGLSYRSTSEIQDQLDDIENEITKLKDRLSDNVGGVL